MAHIHLVLENQRWKVVQEGQVLSEHGTREGALAAARASARADRGDLVIEGEEPVRHLRSTRGNDPHASDG